MERLGAREKVMQPNEVHDESTTTETTHINEIIRLCIKQPFTE